MADEHEHKHGLPKKMLGIILALVGGIGYGLYSAGWNIACNDNFHVLKPGELATHSSS